MPMLRFTTSRAMGLAIALTLGSVATAAAQTDTTRTGPRRSRSQLPVRKQQPARGGETTPAPTTGTATNTMAPSRVDTLLVSRTDTTVVMCNCATTQAASTGEVLPLIPARIQRWFGNGLSVGIGGASTHPVGSNMQAYNPGWGINVPITWDPPKSPLGVRLNLGYEEFNAAAAFGVADAVKHSAELDAKFRVPFGRFLKATSGIYLVGGAGVHRFTNYNESVFLTNNLYNTQWSTPALNAQVAQQARSESRTQVSWGPNIGAGLSLGVAMAELFAEARYSRIFTPGKALNYVPIVAGVSFH
jgi:hypothetical protein